jgi:hypothetical protein
MDFEEDMRRCVLAELPHQQRDRTELAALKIRDLLLVYRNWRNRVVSNKPRRVHCSTALLSNPTAADLVYKEALDQIVAFVESGTSIKPHLSRGIKHGFQGKNRRKSKTYRKDLDLLLNDWGIHHLHLSTAIEADGFVARDGPLLFAAFGDGNAFFIDIFSHGDWTREDVIRVIVREWPDAGIICETPNAAGLASPVSEQNREVLRKNHCNAFLAIDGRLYTPAGGGLSSSGVSIRNVLYVDKMLRTVEWFEDALQKPNSNVVTKLAENGFTLPPNPDLQFEFFEDGGYGIVDKRTSFRIRLAQ